MVVPSLFSAPAELGWSRARMPRMAPESPQLVSVACLTPGWHPTFLLALAVSGVPPFHVPCMVFPWNSTGSHGSKAGGADSGTPYTYRFQYLLLRLIFFLHLASDFLTQEMQLSDRPASHTPSNVPRLKAYFDSWLQPFQCVVTQSVLGQ